ncbi:MAG: ABC transporter, partial [Planctomycetaceae bacterium]
RQQKTLVLLLNSPLSASKIYFGKLAATLGFVLVLIALSIPASAACHAMGGISLTRQLIPLYGVLAVLAVELGAVGLWVSSQSRSSDSALRLTYGCVLTLVVFSMVPHFLLQGSESAFAGAAAKLRFVSPLPAVMELLGHRDVGQRAVGPPEAAALYYVGFAMLTVCSLAAATIRRLGFRMLDQPRSQGVITEQRPGSQRFFRRLAFIVDPQRRKSEIGMLANPVMIKEFRSRQFGRLHWLLRLVAGCAMVSLALTWITTLGSADWGVETIGAIIVVLQVALIVLLTPSLAAGLISGEHESGGWKLLRMTPMSAGVILRGKLLSVCWTMLLILCATLPGYIVMVWINPLVKEQVRQVVICLVLTAVFSILLSTTVSSCFRRSAVATATSYVLLSLICVGTLLVWLGRDAPFGHSTVEVALMINPLAAALSIINTPGFGEYNLLPANWWILGTLCVVLTGVLTIRVRQLLTPD